MINMALYKREMKGSIKLLVILGAIITMYVSIIISMYPEMMKTLDSFAQAMPELMAAVGMNADAGTLLGFMVSYLYGFILLIFPMLFCVLRGNALVARYVDNGSMALLKAAHHSIYADDSAGRRNCAACPLQYGPGIDLRRKRISG